MSKETWKSPFWPQLPVLLFGSIETLQLMLMLFIRLCGSSLTKNESDAHETQKLLLSELIKRPWLKAANLLCSS